MTENKRIIINVLATYGRSLFALACGIFTSRWMLMALGEVDYGLYGVIGALVAFVTIINTMLAGAVQRFYAVSIGESMKVAHGESGLEGCRRWFSIAVTCHSVIAALLILIGYPIGVWAIEHYLTIPIDRVGTCIWVFRFSCISCFISMAEVPFSAMYTAKQRIAELTVYSVVQTLLRVLILAYMVHHQGEWLFWMSFWMAVCAFGPQCLIVFRAVCAFPECRYKWKYSADWIRIKKLAAFAGWNAISCLGWVISAQGMVVLVNKCFGPTVNAAMTITTTVKAQASSLTGAMIGAFAPAVNTAYGAGDLSKVRAMAARTSKYAMVLSLLFVIPLALELPTVISLWLKNPPAYTVGLCYLSLAALIVDNAATGQRIAVAATGNIARMSIFGESAMVLSLPIAYALIAARRSPYMVGWGFLIVTMITSCVRVYYARKQLEMGVGDWVFHCIVPVTGVTIVAAVFAALVRVCMSESFVRVVVTSIVAELLFLPMVWLFVMSKDERSFVRSRIGSKLKGRVL